MSLFKAREFWSVDLNVPDAFDSHSLLIESVNCHPCIFLGSHDGYLRVYSPAVKEPSPYKPSDLMYETLFTSPVLQMGLASLVSGSLSRQLAVLHPKAVAVYSVHQVDSEGDTLLSLRHIYQHTLTRAAHTFVTGPFGRVRGRDFLCVQSLDGLLSFFEQEAATFEAQLPDFLLPGPFKYIAATDAFIFQDANQNLTCYTYEELSQASRKPLKPCWTHNIGGYVLDISCITVGDEVNIFILTERNFYNLNELGRITWMKRFEYQPLCFSSYINKFSNQIMSLVCTEFQGINIYEGTRMKWSAKLDFLPVCVTVVDLTHLHGLIVLLSESGFLQCVYLGTMPSLYLIPPTAELDINVVEAEEELKRLQLQITDTELGGNVDDVITVKLNVDSKVCVEVDKIICNVSVELKTLTPVNNVQVVVVVEPPLVASEASSVVASVVDTETVVSKVYVGSQGVVSGLEIKVMVSYVMPNGAPRIVEQSGVLPFEIAMVSSPAAKDSPVKLTVATNKPTCALNELFFPQGEGTANAVGLRFVNSESMVTIVAAKTSQRYRLQGETLEDLALVLSTLIGRLSNHFRKGGDLNLTYGGPLPMQTYYENVERHYELITRRRLKQEQLAQRATQYRTIQKKVLASLKDLTPKPTGALYKVLEDTHEMMKNVIAELEVLEHELAMSRCRLSALTRLILSLLRLMTLTASDLKHLQIAFNPTIHDGDEQGWLEVQNATLSLLVRTTFAKSSKDQNKPGELTLEPLSDVSRLCKLFSTVVDRATKGSSLMERAEFDSERESLPTIPSVKDWKEKEVKVVPRSTKFTDYDAPAATVTRKPSHSDVTPVSPLEEKQEAIYVETEVTIEPTHQSFEEVEADVKTALPPAIFPSGSKQHQIHTETKLDTGEDAIWDINIDEMRI